MLYNKRIQSHVRKLTNGQLIGLWHAWWSQCTLEVGILNDLIGKLIIHHVWIRNVKWLEFTPHGYVATCGTAVARKWVAVESRCTWRYNNQPHAANISQGPFQYPIRSLIARSREISKLRDLCLELSDRAEIWCCRGACQISKRYDNSNYRSRLRDFTRSYDKTPYRTMKWGPGSLKTRGLRGQAVRFMARKVGSWTTTPILNP